MQPVVPVYNGKEPYIFISYAHMDAPRILPLIAGLQKRGFRIWYDTGIEYGFEWPEYIATKLVGSGCVLAFITKNSVESQNCRREINFAIDKRKSMLIVHMEELELPLGMQLQLNTLQAMFRTKSPSDEVFLDKLSNAALLDPCRCPVQEFAPVPPPVPSYAPQPGYAPPPSYAPQPGYAPPAAPSYVPPVPYAPPARFAPQPTPGFVPQPAPGFVPPGASFAPAADLPPEEEKRPAPGFMKAPDLI